VTDDEMGQRTPVTPWVTLWSSILESHAAMSQARHDASLALQRAGYRRQMIEDVALIITELTVNAFTHGATREVAIEIGQAATGESLVITTAHDEGVARFGVEDPPVMALPHEWVGRGRAIVAALSSRFETTQHPPRRVEHVVVIHA